MAKFQLPRSAPEAQGIASSAILAFVDEVDRNISELHSFMLLRHGVVVAEGWWAPYAPTLKHELYSLSKSFTSTAIGFAVAEGRLSVEDKVVSFFPEEAAGNPDENLARMTIHHLLSMSTGHHEDASGRTFSQRNWVKAFLSLPVEHEPGTHFVYNTAATYMLSAILQKVTGEKLIQYLTPRLFQPLGITGATWESCPMGINTGGFGLNVKTEDIARFGQFYLQKGVWNGQRLLPESWIEAASSKQVSNGDDPNNDWNQGYGYQFWRCRHNLYRGDGAFGQFCIVMPEQDAVVAITAGVGDMGAVMNRVWECLLPAMGPDPLPADPEAQAALTGRLAGLKFDPPAGALTSPNAARISGKTISLEPNMLKVKSLTLTFAPDGAQLTFGWRRGSHTFALGQGEWAFNQAKFFSHWQQKIAASGMWVDDNTYQVTLRFYQTPYIRTMLFQLDGERVTVATRSNVDFGPKEGPTLVGKLSD